MREYFFKALKWYVVMVFVIGGAIALAYAGDTENKYYIGPAVLSLGAAFILAVIWKDLPPKTMFVTSVIVGLFIFNSALVPPHIMDYADRYRAEPYAHYLAQLGSLNHYVLATLIVGVLGIPVMTFVFRRLS